MVIEHDQIQPGVAGCFQRFVGCNPAIYGNNEFNAFLGQQLARFDGSYVLTFADFGYADVDGDAMSGLYIVGNVITGGILYLNGNPLDGNSNFVTKAQIDAGELVFVPTANGNGAGYGAFSFQVRDSNGGLDQAAPYHQITIDVTAVNDAPVLADTALSLTVAEDAGVPSGAVGSPISAFTGGISDVDNGASKGIAITGSNQTNGTWYYTRNGGTTWTAVGTVSNTSALLLADNASTRLYFAPKANYSGSSTAALTVRA